MPIHENKYYLSNSEAASWETSCPRVWKARYIDQVIENEPSEAMLYGSWFESLAIGSGVMGKVTEPTPAMAKSAYGPRVIEQAKQCRRFFKAIGGKIIARQPYLYATIQDENGQDINICGGLDLLMGFDDGRNNLIIDTKLTGDTENDFGKFQFGNVDKVNPQQAVHYIIIHKAYYETEADFNYFIFDRSAAMKQKIINVVASEVTRILHVERLSRIYNEITFAIQMDEWEYKNSYDNCRTCAVKCQMERVLPEIIDLIA